MTLSHHLCPEEAQLLPLPEKVMKRKTEERPSPEDNPKQAGQQKKQRALVPVCYLERNRGYLTAL